MGGKPRVTAEEKPAVVSEPDSAVMARIGELLDGLEDRHGISVIMGVLIAQVAKTNIKYGLNTSSFSVQVNRWMEVIRAEQSKELYGDTPTETK